MLPQVLKEVPDQEEGCEGGVDSGMLTHSDSPKHGLTCVLVSLNGVKMGLLNILYPSLLNECRGSWSGEGMGWLERSIDTPEPATFKHNSRQSISQVTVRVG